MVDRAQIDNFIEILTSYTLPRVFNPWNQTCEIADGSQSSEIRLTNLKAVINGCSQLGNVDLWIGRDLGWRGGRRTGVPFVDEFGLESYANSIGMVHLRKATLNGPLKERTATEINLARKRIDRTVFFWNIFPFHPHELDNTLSNRMHTPNERKLGGEILSLVMALITPGKVIAIGNDAAKMINKLGIKCAYVRHPSYGGQAQFHQQLDFHYGLTKKSQPQMELFRETLIAAN